MWSHPQLCLLLFLFRHLLILQAHLCFATNLNPKLTRGEACSPLRMPWWLATGKIMTTRWRDEIDWYHCIYWNVGICQKELPSESLFPLPFLLHHLTFSQLLISFFHHFYRNHYPLYCLGTCCRYDLSCCFSLFRWWLFKSYLSSMSPSILSSLSFCRYLFFALLTVC